MRMVTYIAGTFVCAVMLGGCNTSKKDPNEQNFGVAINQALATQGLMCLPPIKWPATAAVRAVSDIPDMTPEGLAALETVGLAKSVETTMDIELSWGKVRKQPVKSYSLTEAAQPYLHENGKLCWAQKTFDHIVNWSAPSNNQSSILYVYKLASIATWANSADIQNAFPEIKSGLAGIGKNQSHCTADLTNGGWRADCPVS